MNLEVDPKYNLHWQDKKYAFFGIPQAVIDNNSKAQQNTEWSGSFNPLQ